MAVPSAEPIIARSAPLRAPVAIVTPIADAQPKRLRLLDTLVNGVLEMACLGREAERSIGAAAAPDAACDAAIGAIEIQGMRLVALARERLLDYATAEAIGLEILAGCRTYHVNDPIEDARYRAALPLLARLRGIGRAICARVEQELSKRGFRRGAKP